MAVSCPVCVPKASVLISPANLVWPVRSGHFPRLSGSPQVVARVCSETVYNASVIGLSTPPLSDCNRDFQSLEEKRGHSLSLSSLSPPPPSPPPPTATP